MRTLLTFSALLVSSLPAAEPRVHRDDAAAVEAIRKMVWKPKIKLDRTGHVTELSIHSTYARGHVQDNVLPYVKQFRHLKSLHIDGSITDQGMAHFRAMPQLESLVLSSWSVKDKGLSHLKALKNLKNLRLDTYHSEEGVKHLAALTKLESLSLIGSFHMHGDGVKYLKNNKKLRTLSLGHSPLTDEGLSNLRHVPQIETLTLAIDRQYKNTRVRGTFLTVLKDLPNLKSLKLLFFHRHPAREALTHLFKSKSLENLELQCLHLNEVREADWQAIGKAKQLRALKVQLMHDLHRDPARMKREFDRVRGTLKKLLPKTKIEINP